MSFSEDFSRGKVFEQIAAEVYAELIEPGAVLFPTRSYADVDFAIIGPDGSFKGFLEVKSRRIPAGAYPTTAVNWRKYEAAVAASKYLKAKTFCLVVFTDTAILFDLGRTPDEDFEIDRWDRRGPPVRHAGYKVAAAQRMPEVFAAIALRLAGLGSSAELN